MESKCCDAQVIASTMNDNDWQCEKCSMPQWVYDVRGKYAEKVPLNEKKECEQNMKYKVLIDYGSEGMKFMDGEFGSVAIAVKEAIAYNSAFSFQIVQIVDWEAKEIK